jgi:hypothetical protein
MTTNRPRGRPRLHSDRWLALFCLFYRLAEWLAVQDQEIAKWEREFRKRPTQRRITALRMHMQADRVTKTLTRAQKLELFTRGRDKGRFTRRRTAPGGSLTDRGWSALGPVPRKWSEMIGNEWQAVFLKPKKVRLALDIIEQELLAEERTSHNSLASPDE